MTDDKNTNEPIVERTLRDVSPSFILWVHCRGCGHQTPSRSRDEWAARHGLDADLDELVRRLRCLACGRRDAVLYRAWSIPARPDAVP